MDPQTVRVLAIAVVTAMLIAPICSIARKAIAAALVNAAIGVLFLAFELPTLFQWVSNQSAYIAQNGQAAVGQLPMLAWGAVLAILALLGSALSIKQLAAAFWIGWTANIVPTVILCYMAFWFHVF